MGKCQVRLLHCIYCLLVLFTMFFLSGKQVSAESARPVFKVGVSLPLTGSAAEFGLAVRDGILFAIQQRPKEFERVQFIFEDNRYDNQASLASFHKLKQRDRVDLVYIWGYGPVQVVAPLSEARQIPLIGVSADSEIFRNSRYVIPFCASDRDFAEVLLNYLRGKKYRKLAIIKSDVAFFEGVADQLKRQLDKEFSLEFFGPLSPSDVDFRSLIGRVRAGNFDAVGAFLLPGQISSFHRQMSEVKFNPVTFSTDFIENESELNVFKDFAAGIVYPGLSVSESFAAQYRARFGDQRQMAWAGSGYDFASLLLQVFGETSTSLTAEQIVRALRSARSFEGAVGTIRYQESEGWSGFSLPVAMKIVQGEEVRVLERS